MNPAGDEFDDELVEHNDLPEGFARQSRLVDRPAEADSILVVDVSNLAYRSAFAYADLTVPGSDRLSGHVYGSLRLLQATLRNHVRAGTWCFAFCYDGAGATAHRQGILPGYKANREVRFDPKPDVKAVLRNIPGIHIEVDKREGDDAVAWVADKLAAKQVTVLSGDKDLWALLEHENVNVFSPNLNRQVTHEDILKRYHVYEPQRIYLAKALFGDSSDGVKGWSACRKKKGVEGCATVQHRQVVPMLQRSTTGTLEAFYDALAVEPGVTDKVRGALTEMRSAIEANYRVVQPMLDGFGPGSVGHSAASEGRKAALMADIKAWGCNSLVDGIDMWFGQPFQVEDEV